MERGRVRETPDVGRMTADLPLCQSPDFPRLIKLDVQRNSEKGHSETHLINRKTLVKWFAQGHRISEWGAQEFSNGELTQKVTPFPTALLMRSSALVPRQRQGPTSKDRITATRDISNRLWKDSLNKS